MLLTKLVTALNQWKVPYAIVGGYAVALHGAVRGTVDVDLVLRLKERDFVLLEEALLSIGLESKLPLRAKQVFQYREEYIANKNLIAWNFYNPKVPVEAVDVILTENLSDMKSMTIMWGGLKINVAAIEDLIAMKSKADRPQDRADIDALNKILKQQKSGHKK